MKIKCANCNDKGFDHHQSIPCSVCPLGRELRLVIDKRKLGGLAWSIKIREKLKTLNVGYLKDKVNREKSDGKRNLKF